MRARVRQGLGRGYQVLLLCEVGDALVARQVARVVRARLLLVGVHGEVRHLVRQGGLLVRVRVRFGARVRVRVGARVRVRVRVGAYELGG